MSNTMNLSGIKLERDFTFNVPVKVGNADLLIDSVKIIAFVSSKKVPSMGAYLLGRGERVYNISNQRMAMFRASISFDVNSGKDPLHVKSWSVKIQARKKGGTSYNEVGWIASTDPNINLENGYNTGDRGTITH